MRLDPGVTSHTFYPHGISAAIFRGALVSVSFLLPDSSEVSVIEVVDGRVTHAGRDAVLFQIDVEVPPDFPLAAAGYSVVDIETGVVLASRHSLAHVVNAIGTETLTTTSHAIANPD